MQGGMHKQQLKLAPEPPTEIIVGLDAVIRRHRDQGMLVPVKGGNGLGHFNQGGTAKAPAFVSEKRDGSRFFYMLS